MSTSRAGAGFPAPGVVSDIATDSQDRVYACVRLRQEPDHNEGEIWVFDRDGIFLASWGKDIFDIPHGMWIGPDDDIYYTDSGDHTVTKFDTDGRVLMTLGTKGKPGPPGEPFRSPTRAVLSSSGEIFISDGYQQNRCHRFTADGQKVLSWGSGDPVYYQQYVLGNVTGTGGSGPGEFNLPHDITVDRNDRAYVLDRENNRLQVFTNEGEFIEQWTDVPGGKRLGHRRERHHAHRDRPFGHYGSYSGRQVHRRLGREWRGAGPVPGLSSRHLD